ncbi:hypothetical protein LCGC14_1629310, partial [marine sediment metagenome]
MPDEWDIAYDTVLSNQKPQGSVSEPIPEEDKWDKAYNTVVGGVEPKEQGTFVQRMK